MLMDFSKKEIDVISKSDFIKEILKEENISIRELGRRTNISHSTLQDWVSMRQLKKNNILYGTNIQGVYNHINKLLFLLSRDNFEYDTKTMNKIEELYNIVNNILVTKKK
jgi:transcriptional regulator with XRE-family HTH domain